MALLLALAWFGRDGVRASGFATGVPAATQVLTANADLNRDSWFSTETVLTPSNVSGGTFGQLYSWSLTGRVMAEPLIAPGVITSAGTKDLLIATTVGGYIYAFDANNYSSRPVWSASFGPGFLNSNDAGFYGETQSCVSTPAIDLANSYLYAVCANSLNEWNLVKLNLATGATITSTQISGQYPGTGDPNGGDTIIDGELQFDTKSHYNRTALALANGNVYVGFGSMGDAHPWHGWVFAYSTSSLSQIGVYCITPSNYGGAVWNAGGGLSVDQSGNLYAFLGNGGYDGSTAFANSIIKLNSSLSLVDWFTPSNWATLESDDYDLASSHAILMRSSNGSTLLVGGAKDGRVYVVDSTCMGELQGSGSPCPSPQLWYTVEAGQNNMGIYGGIYANNTLFVPNVSGYIYAYSFSPSSGSFNQTPTTTSATYAYPGAQLSYSSNGATNGVLWALTCASNSITTAVQATLRAFNPSTMSEIYNSGTTEGDAIGTLNKFNIPVVWNGHVFVGSGSAVYVFGLGAHP